MRKEFPSLFALFCWLSCSTLSAQAEINSDANFTSNQIDHPSVGNVKTEGRSNLPVSPTNKFQAFTGKITKDKVRLRLQPNYDGPVIRELNRHDLVIVLGETEDFYSVQPPTDFKAFVFRTFVLDNVIEGSHVNVRLKPELDAPVITQLNSGDHVSGSVYPGNTKWLEIKLPETTHFYIAKEYIEKAGDAGFKSRLEKKHADAYLLFKSTEAVSRAEILKPFEQIQMEGIKANYQHLMQDFPEFPEIESKAKEAWITFQEAYTTKKIAYLENQSRSSNTTVEANKKLAAELQAQKNKVMALEQQIEKNRQLTPSDSTISSTSSVSRSSQLPFNMSAWLSVEEKLFNDWSQQTGNHNPQEFYAEQRQQSFILRGVIDPYNRPIKNKPGDYMLLSTGSNLPIAFLYSTFINLQDYVGHEVAILVSPRPNHHFAFPAYFVLAVE